MEQRQQRQCINLLDDHGFLRTETLTVLLELLETAPKAVMIYSWSSKIGDAVSRSLDRAGVAHVYITGKNSEPDRNVMLTKFKTGQVSVLIGTDALATGTDGLDKVCDTLVIVNDTSDNAQRKQLMGRILPRGLNVDASGKTIVRLVF
jgi:superfamily II DNA or RNA helicase